MRLLRLHPNLATRDCRDCLINDYNKNGEPTFHNGIRLKRRPGNEAPCRTRTGCPKGTAETATTLTLQNMLAMLHYETCKATGQFPDDPIVATNATILRMIDREADRRERDEQNELIIQILSARF